MTTIIQHEIKSHFHPLSMGEIIDIVTEVCLDLPILCALAKLIPISKPHSLQISFHRQAQCCLLDKVVYLLLHEEFKEHNFFNSSHLLEVFGINSDPYAHVTQAQQHLRHHMLQHQILRQKVAKISQAIEIPSNNKLEKSNVNGMNQKGFHSAGAMSTNCCKANSNQHK